VTVAHSDTRSETRRALDRFRLDDRVVVVTGASSGLGVAFAQACAEAGADVVVAARRKDRLADTVHRVERAGRAGLAVEADIAIESDCRAVVAAAVERFGRIDVLVNNAGIEDHDPASRLSLDTFRRVIDVNLTACFVLSQEAAAVMPRGSSIINVSSILAQTTFDAPHTAYSASKAGVLGLTRTLARQWTGRKGIRVNAVLPGLFPTEMTDGTPETIFEGRLPMGRFGRPDELAAAVLFLASDASSYVTGAELVVDGGLVLT
jgi:NAD(P)-dependent dehydrogenase (short-subunit alcohol dehydrogenase family)